MQFFRSTLIVVALMMGFFMSIDTQAGDPLRKLGRGISNVAFGALEVPMKIYDVNKDEGGVASVTYGTLKGISWFVARECVGVLEVVTFLIPLPGCTDEERDTGWGYGPIMRPEWVMDLEHDPYNVVYQDTPIVH